MVDYAGANVLVLGEVLRQYPGLAITPTENGVQRITGLLSFSAKHADFEQIDDTYDVSIAIPPDFPRHLPDVEELGGRIPKSFHTYTDGTLCLGSPVRQRLVVGKHPSLRTFIERCLIPYLYGFSYFEKHGELPFGELAHGNRGIRQDYESLFGVAGQKAAQQMVFLASIKKRAANKQLCPCGSGLRLGKCHNRRVNHLRRMLGRSWFRREYHDLTGR